MSDYMRMKGLYIYNGHDFITNFDVEQRPIYEKAIRMFKEQFGDDGLYIKDDALDITGRNYKSMNSLHYKYKNRSLSDFWNIFYSIK